MIRLVHFLLAGASLMAVISAASAEEIRTPEQVWAGYDPAAEPLEIEVTKTWQEENLQFREFRFTGMTQGESKVRVYAIYCAPEDGKALPAVLHIHGGGQTASPEWLRF